MKLRKATLADGPAVVALYREAQAFLAAQGIDQWQDGTGPDVDLVTSDVARGWGRVFLIGGQVAATAALIDEPEPAYDQVVEGAWQVRSGAVAPAGVTSSYATIHRVSAACT